MWNGQECETPVNPCAGVSCNSPPSPECIGSDYTTYSLPGTCSEGTCSYTTTSTSCPSAGCADADTRFYDGACTASGCSSSTEYCGGDGYACADGETRVWRDNFCDDRPNEYDCDYGDSGTLDCNTLNGWVGGGEAGCGVWNDPASNYYDYGCSNNACTSATTDTKDYDGDDGWYDGGDSGPGCTTTNDPTSYRRDYYVTADTPDSNHCNADSADCDGSDGWSGGGDSGPGCTTTNDPASQYRDYYVTADTGSCTYGTTGCDSKDCDSSDGWYGGGDSGACSQRDDPTAYLRDYYVKTDTGECDYTPSCDSKDCDGDDGWYGGGNTAGCGDDPSSEDRDYYYYTAAGTCTDISCDSKDCDSQDVCSSVCEGTVIRQYLDAYVVAGTGGCSSYYGTAVEDCATKQSDDPDSNTDNSLVIQGTVTDYTGCSGGACTSTGYTDYCDGNTVVEYTRVPDITSVNTYRYNCEGFEGSGSYYCSGSRSYRTEWGCSSGACSDAAASDTYTDCANGCNPSTGRCYASACSPTNPCTPPKKYTSEGVVPNPICGGQDGNDKITYPDPGTCADTSGGGFSCSYPPSSTACPTTGCSAAWRQTGGCSGGACYLNNAEDCAAIASTDSDGQTYTSQGRCTDYTGCSGGSCTSSLIEDECRDSNIVREYYASGAACSYIDYDCRNLDTYYCDGITSVQRAWGCVSSPGYCSNTSEVRTSCANGCNPSTGQCYADLCSPNPCTSANPDPAKRPPSNSCSGNTRTYYPGTCTQSGSSYSCSYSPSTETCATSGCNGETRQEGGCAPGGCYMNDVQDCNSANNGCYNSGDSYQACSNSSTSVTRQDRVYRDYTCSSGSCTIASSSPSSSCPPVDTNAVTCTKDDDICFDSGTLRRYAAAACSSGQCDKSYTDSSCTYGCMSLSGNDQCASNTAPTLSGLSLSGTSGSYAASGQSVAMTSAGSDPNGEQVRLRCGTASGAADLCTSSFAGSNSSCFFNSPWGDSSDHTVYCFLEDMPGARSPVLQATLSADNTPPIITVSRSPSGQVATGTAVSVTATASDGRSGVSSIAILVNGVVQKTCSSTTCIYTFSPSYGQHIITSDSVDRVGNSSTSAADSMIANDAPVVQPISYTGSCKQGSTITLRCPASDANQAASTLSAKAWAGECGGSNCFATRSWVYGGFMVDSGNSLENGLVSYWNFNETSGNRMDAIGTNHLTPVNGVSYDIGTGTSATRGNAVKLVSVSIAEDRVDQQYLQIDDNPSVSTGNIDFTFAGWVKLGRTDKYMTILSKGDTSTTNEYWLGYNNGKFEFSVHNGASWRSVYATGSPPAGYWYFVVAWHDSVNDLMGIQIDNGQPNTISYSSGVQDSSSRFIIGTWADQPDWEWDGLIDETGFWKRVLTTQEKNDLWNAGWSNTYTRRITYLNGDSMTYQNNRFERDITITLPSGASIAATCQATDELAATSNWGDAYPLCVVDQCQNPPAVTVQSISPNPSGPGEIQVAFSLDRAGQGEPTVRVKPGSQRGGTNEITASQVSKNGNSYVYSFTAQPNALSGIADISIGGGFKDGTTNCQFSQISQMTIDTDKPSTTMLCNNQPCTDSIYVGPVSMVLNCDDPTTACDSTRFGIGGPALQEYDVPRMIAPTTAGLNTLTVNYTSNDTFNNVEQTKSQQLKIYMPPDGIEEEARLEVVHEESSVLVGDTLTSRIFCFMRDKQTKNKTRECDIDPASLSVIIDKGKQDQKDYFNYYYPGYDYPRYTSTYDVSRIIAYLAERQVLTSRAQPVDNIQYTFSKHWTLPIYTSEFHSEVCVEGGDQQSGMGGIDCENYTVSNSELKLDVSFPELGVTVPRTTDGQNEANFTKTMVINFEAAPSISTVFTSNPCTGLDCRVDFNFNGGAWKQTTWNDFEQAYIPYPSDAASNALACDSYHALNVKAVKQMLPDSGIETTAQKNFFVSCEPRMIVAPAEVRLALSAQPGDIFELTAINPRDEEKAFEIEATTTDTNGYPLPWISFACNSQPGCEAGPGPGLPNDDFARLTVPAGLSRSVFVTMSTAARSGSFPIRFRGTYTEIAGGNTVENTFVVIGTLLIFAEGLDEFAAWQLAILVLLVIAVLYYSGFGSPGSGKTKKKRPARRKK